MVVRNKKIIIDGQEVEVPIFDTSINVGKDIDIDILEKLTREEKIEAKLQEVINEIKNIKTKYKIIIKNIDYFYEVGKVLQFVDKESLYLKQKGLMWQRLVHDLAPELFLFDVKKSIQETKRYPEFMYLLAKVPKKFLIKASWDQWYEIMKFKEVYNKPDLLKRILLECKSVGAGPSLRNQIKLQLSHNRNNMQKLATPEVGQKRSPKQIKG